MMPQDQDQIDDVCERFHKVNSSPIGYDQEVDFTAGLLATVMRQAGLFFNDKVCRDVRPDPFTNEQQVARRRAYARHVLRAAIRELSEHYATEGSPLKS